MAKELLSQKTIETEQELFNFVVMSHRLLKQIKEDKMIMVMEVWQVYPRKKQDPEKVKEQYQKAITSPVPKPRGEK